MPATRNLCTALSTAATGAQAPIRLNKTPLHGGYGREAMLQLAAAVPAGVTVLIQGHPSPLDDPPQPVTRPGPPSPRWYPRPSSDRNSLICRTGFA